MQQVEKEVFAIDVVDVALIGIGPTHRPRINNDKRIATVLELGPSADSGYVSDAERVLPSKTCPKLVIGDAAGLRAFFFRCGIVLFCHLVIVVLRLVVLHLVIALRRLIFVLIGLLRLGLILARRFFRIVLRFAVLVLLLCVDHGGHAKQQREN